jgi:hypothetical protein
MKCINFHHQDGFSSTWEQAKHRGGKIATMLDIVEARINDEESWKKHFTTLTAGSNDSLTTLLTIFISSGP